MDDRPLQIRTPGQWTSSAGLLTLPADAGDSWVILGIATNTTVGDNQSITVGFIGGTAGEYLRVFVPATQGHYHFPRPIKFPRGESIAVTKLENSSGDVAPEFVCFCYQD